MTEWDYRKKKILEVVRLALPDPAQITDVAADRESYAVRLTWRGVRYRVDERFFVEVVDGGVLRTTDAATLMAALLRRWADAVPGPVMVHVERDTLEQWEKALITAMHPRVEYSEDPLSMTRAALRASQGMAEAVKREIEAVLSPQDTTGVM